MKDDKTLTYFKYFKECHYPVYIALTQGDFDPSLVKMLTDMRFSVCKDDDMKELEKRRVDKTIRVLHITEAGPRAAAILRQVSLEDSFGPESVSIRMGQKVYRYNGLALVLYSLATHEWELGATSDFGSEKRSIETKVIINRFLSWALFQQGVVGFWGVPVEEGVVVMNQTESKGEVVFFDLKTMRLLSIEGEKRLKHGLQLIRLDKTLVGRSIRMSKEESMGFLSQRCSFFDYDGLVVAVRQMVQSVAQMGAGVVLPFEHFRPRSDLSL